MWTRIRQPLAVSFAGLVLALPLALSLSAQSAGLDTLARRAALLPLYERVVADPEYQRLKTQADGAKPGSSELDEFLDYLPLSPLDLWDLEMRTLGAQAPAPVEYTEWHRRWLELHEADARKLWGDTHVDAQLGRLEADARWTPEISPASEHELEEKGFVLLPFVDTNRNMAAFDSTVPKSTQSEISLAVKHSDPKFVVAAAVSFDSENLACSPGNIAVFYSNDGGIRWKYTCAPGASDFGALPLCGAATRASDPDVFWGADGRAYMTYVLICSTSPAKTAVVVARSINGASWSPQGIVANGFSANKFHDRPAYAIDTNPASPFSNRHYACWRDETGTTRVAFSTDDGVTWSATSTPSAPGAELNCQMAIGSNGTLHLALNTFTCSTPSSCSQQKTFYARSTNGGVSWAGLKEVRNHKLIFNGAGSFPLAQNVRGLAAWASIAVDAEPTSGCADTLYIAFPDFATGEDANDSDVFVTRSTDNGVTWSAPIKVNTDGLANAPQFHPNVVVDQQNGNVYLAWLDGRADIAGGGTQAYFARSTTCGQTWSSNTVATRTSREFDNSTSALTNVSTVAYPTANGNQYLEYIGFDVHDHELFLAWPDSRHTRPSPGIWTSSVAQVENVGFARAIYDATLTLPQTFDSIAAEDGYVIESLFDTNFGADFEAGGDEARVGDELVPQVKAIFSFDTSSLPDAAALQSAVLRVRRKSQQGDPVATLGPVIQADIRTGGFSSNAALQSSDFEASSTASGICSFVFAPTEDGLWYECRLSTTGLAAVNKTGRTQFRLYFLTEDDNDFSFDTLNFATAEFAALAGRPQLIVRY